MKGKQDGQTAMRDIGRSDFCPMDTNREIFAAKLYEMEQQYGKMRKGLHACGREDRNRLREELQTAKKEYCQHFEALQKSIEGCRSQAVAELARAQIACSREMESLLKDGRLERYLHSEKSSPAEDQAEAVTLYAEYAIDYAIQSMLYALVAALFAADLQMSTEEQKGVSESCRK